MKNPINTRILSIYNKLLEAKIVNNEREFGDRIGYSQGAISYIFNGKRNPGKKMMDAIIEEFGVNKLYLENGKEPPFLYGDRPALKTDVSNVKSIDIGGPRNNLIIVPLKALGGFLSGYANKVFMDTLERVPFPFIHGECFAFEVEGFSMYETKMIDGELFERGYKPQSYVICTMIEGFDHLRKNKDYVFQTIDGIILKRFVKIEGKLVHVKSINEEYNPVDPLPMRSIKVMYFVEIKDGRA